MVSKVNELVLSRAAVKGRQRRLKSVLGFFRKLRKRKFPRTEAHGNPFFCVLPARRTAGALRYSAAAGTTET